MTALLDIEPIASADAGLRSALLDAHLPIDDLDEPGRAFYRFSDAGAVVGYGGLEPCGTDVLLRSVVVLPAWQGRGFGRLISERLLATARHDGARSAWLLTTTAEDFFHHLGFTRIDRAAAPPAILATRQATTICTTAALLTRPLA
jgi:N-acetylglutamate synthase-like GNAT family acetyltransferase